MTTHVVCLDGTGQQRPQPNPTNISKIFDALGGTVVDGGNNSWETTSPAGAPAQTGKYLPGVGAQGDVILQILGKAFGDGIAEQIVRGYTFLSRNYTAGDEIIITGFSRGAAAARALAGFVAVQGLLDKTKYDVDNKDTAYLRAIGAWYQYRANDPELANQDRLTSIGDEAGRPVPQLTPDAYAAIPRIEAVAAFDTVSSLGLPQVDANGDAIYDFTICDTVLNPKVINGFHALSADEIRDVFAPTFWTARGGIVQVIFPGAHSDVGGGYPDARLSDGALNWMLGRLAGVGLDIPAPAQTDADPVHGDGHDDSVTWPFRMLPNKPRLFPRDATPDASIGARWSQPCTVLPADVTGPYRSTGTYSGGISIHPYPF
jgi:uncharacterized protein (DUF2235 family)